MQQITMEGNMSKIIYLTDMKEVTSLRYKCNHCGTIVEVPITVKMQVQPNCVNCGLAIPQNLRKAAFALKDAVVTVANLENIYEKDVTLQVITEKEN